MQVALSFNGSDGNNLVCGTLSGSPSTIAPAAQTDPIPSFFEWDFDGDIFNGVRVSTIDYALVAAT